MKRWFLRLSIKFKLYTIVLLASTLALLLATSASFIIQQQLVRKQLRDEIKTLADVIGENSRAGVTFEDREALKIILHSLNAKESITAGRIYGHNGDLLAEYERGGQKSDSLDHHEAEEILAMNGLRFRGRPCRTQPADHSRKRADRATVPRGGPHRNPQQHSDHCRSHGRSPVLRPCPGHAALFPPAAGHHCPHRQPVPSDQQNIVGTQVRYPGRKSAVRMNWANWPPGSTI